LTIQFSGFVVFDVA